MTFLVVDFMWVPPPPGAPKDVFSQSCYKCRGVPHIGDFWEILKDTAHGWLCEPSQSRDPEAHILFFAVFISFFIPCNEARILYFSGMGWGRKIFFFFLQLSYKSLDLCIDFCVASVQFF